MFRRRRADLLILAVLFLLPLLLFWPVTLGGKTLLPVDNLYQWQPWKSAAEQFNAQIPQNQLVSDLILENYAWKHFIVESISKGQIPLWNPNLFAGAPFLANGQHSAYYPFSVLFYFLPLTLAYGWFTVSQLFLAGAFMYVFTRVLGMGRLASLTAAIIYQLSGFYIVSVVFTMIIAAAAWLPLLLAAIELIIQQRSIMGRPSTIPWIALGAIALACQIMAGHIEITYYTLLIMALYALWRLGGGGKKQDARCKTQDGEMQRVSRSEIRRYSFHVPRFTPTRSCADRARAARRGHVGGSTAALRRDSAAELPRGIGHVRSGAQLGAAAASRAGDVDAQLLRQSGGAHRLRHHDGAERAAQQSVQRAESAGRVQHHVGHQELRRGRGVPGHSAAAAGDLCHRARRLSAHPIAPLVLRVPRGHLAGLHVRHAAVRDFVLRPAGHQSTALAVPLDLAVHDLDRGAGGDRRRCVDDPLSARSLCAAPRGPIKWFCLNGPVSFRTILAALAFWPGAIMLVGLFASRLIFPTQSIAFADKLLQSMALANTAFDNPQLFYSHLWRNVLLFASFLTMSGVVLRVSLCPIFVPLPKGRQVAIWKPLLLIVVALDLLVGAIGFNPAVDPKLLDYTPPVIGFLKQDQSQWRFTTFDPHGRKTFNANGGWPYGLQDVRGYDSIILKQYADYMGVIEAQNETQFNRIQPITTYGGLDSPMLDLLNVKYVLTDPDVPIESPKYKLVYDAEVKVYENLGVLPRAFTMPIGCETITDDPLTALRQYDPRTTVIVDGNQRIPPSRNAANSSVRADPADRDRLSDQRCRDQDASRSAELAGAERYVLHRLDGL